MTELRIRVDGFDPWLVRANAKDRMTRRGRKAWRYTTPKHASASDTVEQAARAAVAELGAGAVAFPSGPVRVDVTYRRAKRSKAHGACECFGDVDGPTKAVIDAVVRGGAMADDVQIVELVARKALARLPSLEIVIRPA